VPQFAAVMGPCIAGGAYLPALSDVILMVEGTSFMGLGGPNLVKGATGQTVDSEELGGAWTHNAISGVAHYRLPDDRACVARLRELVGELPYAPPGYHSWTRWPCIAPMTTARRSTTACRTTTASRTTCTRCSAAAR
jgi:3-methylcrotonyl-CoA carboxylase beta subunit